MKVEHTVVNNEDSAIFTAVNEEGNELFREWKGDFRGRAGVHVNQDKA